MVVVQELRGEVPAQHSDDPGSNPELILEISLLILATVMVRKARGTVALEIKWSKRRQQSLDSKVLAFEIIDTIILGSQYEYRHYVSHYANRKGGRSWWRFIVSLRNAQLIGNGQRNVLVTDPTIIRFEIQLINRNSSMKRNKTKYFDTS